MATILAVQPISKVSAQDLVRDLDLTDDEVQYLLSLAARVKRTPGKFARALGGKYISLLFEKPSLRTRLTFELAIKQLGGDAVMFDGPVGAREPLKDVARNLERWVQGIVARTFSQSTVEELAHWSSAPVINALTDLYHPCQALADVFTLQERFGELRGLKLAFVGDGNNVAHSLMLTAVRLGMDFTIATPAGYAPNAEIVSQAEGLAAISGARLRVTNDPAEAVNGCARGVYRCLDQHGAGKGISQAAQAVCGAPGESGPDGAGPARCGIHALPAGEARRGSHGRGDGIGAVDCVRSGGEPAARTEGAAVDDVGMRKAGVRC